MRYLLIILFALLTSCSSQKEANMDSIDIKISKEIYNENLNILEDLIKAAHNNAKASLKSKTEEEISKLTGGLGIPGFKWPI